MVIRLTLTTVALTAFGVVYWLVSSERILRSGLKGVGR